MDDAATDCDTLDSELASLHGWLSTAYGNFVTENGWGTLAAATLVDNAATWIGGNRSDSAFLRTAAAAFRAADQRGADLCHATEGQVATALAAAGLNGPRTDIVVQWSAATGGVQTTGFTNDPVSAASGNFLEVEVDLGFGPTLRSLQLRRTYNSLDTAVGPFGVGWSSWASTRLRLAAGGTIARLRGPDGQRADVPLPTGTIAGFEGRVERDGDGLVARFASEATSWRFDAEGRPIEIDGGPGEQVRLRWDGPRLVRLEHTRGRWFELVWDGERIVAGVADDGRRVTYGYDAAGQLVVVDGPMGRRRYECGANGLVLAVTDGDGVVAARNTYDRTRRVVTQETPFGRRVRFWYRPGLVTEVDDDSGGPVEAWVHDEEGRLARVVDGEGRATTKVHDDRGNLVSVTDRRGATTRYVRDGAGECRRIERPDGTAVDLTWDDRHRCVTSVGPDGATVRFTYTGDDRIPTTIEDPEGGITRCAVVDGLVEEVVDADGVVLRFEHDEQGRVVAVTDGAGATRRCEWDATGQLAAVVTPLGHRTELEHDAGGRLVARRDPDGAVTTIERSAAGRVEAVVDPAGARRELRYGAHGEVVEDVDPVGGLTAYRWDQLGAVTAEVLPDGAEWAFERDALSRVVAVTDPAGAVWRREYDAEGDLVASVTPAGTRRSVTVDPTGAISGVDDGVAAVRFDQDDAGRVVAQVRADGSTVRAGYDRCGRIVTITEATGGVSRFAYSPAGRLVAAVGPTGGRTTYRYDEAGRLCEVVLANGGRQRLRYDADGRLVRVVGPTGETTRYSYDPCGRPLTVTHPNGGVSRYAYDRCGRVVTVTEPGGGTTGYDYDLAGRVVCVTDPNGGRLRYERDVMGRVVAQVDPLGGRTRFRYDGAGRLCRVTDPLGRTTRYAYNADGRLVGRVDPDGARHWWEWSASDDLVGWGVDDTAVRLRRDVRGRALRLERDGAVLERELDADGNLVAQATPSASLSWERDLGGKVTAAAVAAPGLRTTTVRYDRDAAGRTVAVDDPALGRLRIARDAAGRPTLVTGPGLREERRWTHGHLTGWARTLGGQPTVAARYCRAASGQVVEQQDGDGTRIRFTYDAAGQLTSTDGPGGAWSFGWDAAGRLVEEHAPGGERRFAYDAAGQLRRITAPQGAIDFDWDPCGRRVRATGPAPNVRQHAAWDAFGQLATVTTTTSDGTTATRRFDHDPLGQLAAIDGIPVVWDPTQPHARPWSVGSRRLAGAGSTPLAFVDTATDTATDADSAVAWLPGSAHGQPDGLDAWGAATGGVPGGRPDLGWQGELAVDGLSLLGARAYDPATRSFLSPDPLSGIAGHPWTTNRYHYAANDPVGHADPAGLKPIDDKQLAAIRDGWDDNAWQRYEGYIIAGGLLIVGGAALLIPGVGPVVGGMIIGAAISGAISASVQQATTGGVSYKQLAVDMAIGAAGGGAGAATAVGTAGLRTAASFGIRAGVDIGVNTLGGMGSRAATGQDPFDPQQIGFDVLTGGAGSAAGSGVDALRAARNPGLRQVDDVLGGAGVPPGSAGTGGPAVVPGSPGRTSIVGHGVYHPASGSFTIPDGTTLHGYAPHGTTITTNTGRAITAGRVPASYPHHTAYGPGTDFPDYTVGPPPSNVQFNGNPISVQQPTLLSDIVQPNMGDVHLAFCFEEVGNPNPVVYDVNFPP